MLQSYQTLSSATSKVGWPAFFVLVTVFLYCCGVGSHGGYIEEFQLNREKVTLGFHSYLYQGFFSVWLEAFILLSFSFCLSLIAFVVVSSWQSGVADTFHERKILADKLAKKERFWWLKFSHILVWKKVRLRPRYRKNRMSDSERGTSYFVVITGVPVLLFFVFVISLVNARQDGRERGGRDFSKYLSGTEEGRYISVKIEGNTKRLFFITCGTHNCAGIEDDSRTVYYFPMNREYSFVVSVDESNNVDEGNVDQEKPQS